jgi:hypothetical protein
VGWWGTKEYSTYRKGKELNIVSIAEEDDNAQIGRRDGAESRCFPSDIYGYGYIEKREQERGE